MQTIIEWLKISGMMVLLIVLTSFISMIFLVIAGVMASIIAWENIFVSSDVLWIGLRTSLLMGVTLAVAMLVADLSGFKDAACGK